MTSMTLTMDDEKPIVGDEQTAPWTITTTLLNEEATT